MTKMNNEHFNPVIQFEGKFENGKFIVKYKHWNEKEAQSSSTIVEENN